jgi:hypothetical protein
VEEESPVAEPFPEAHKQGDWGYQGRAGIAVPHKQLRGGELTAEQGEENRALARVRVKVEHAMRRVKGFKIVREKDRLATGWFPMVASAVVGLVPLNRIFG